MNCREIVVDKKHVYVALDSSELRTDFDTGVTKVTLEYFQGEPESQNSLCEIKAELTTEFIDDTYNLSGQLSDETKIKAMLDLGERVYQEKKGIPTGFELVRGLKANYQLRYIPKIDMQPTNARAVSHL